MPDAINYERHPPEELQRRAIKAPPTGLAGLAKDLLKFLIWSLLRLLFGMMR